MSQVQNNTLHKYVQPTVLMAIALIAGSKRCIQFFPGASKGGLLLAAGLGSAATYFSPQITTPALLKTDQKSERALHSLIRVTASLALGTITAHFADKILKGRVSLCLHAAGRFIALETLLAIAFAGYSAYKASPTPGGGGDPKTLEAKHAAYQKDLDTWNKLDGKERSDFAKECFDKDLEVLHLKGGDFDIKSFEDLPKQDVAKLTANQLEWFSAICTRGLVLTIDQEFDLNAARSAKGLDTSWTEVTKAHVDHALDQGLETLLHGYYSTHADAWNKLDDKTRGAFVNAWFKADLPVISLEKANVCTEALQKDLPDDISSCTKNQIELMTELSPHLKIQMESQFALNAARQTHGLEPVWGDDVTQDYVKYALKEKQTVLLHAYFSENPFALALIKGNAEGITEAFNKASAASGLDPIPCAHDILIGLKTDEIDALTKDEAHFASGYMLDKDTITDFNKHLSPEQQLAYNAVFEKHGTKRFWIWPVVQGHVDFMATHDASLTRFHRKMSGAPEAFGAIPDAQRQTLEKLFVDKGLAGVPNAFEILQKLTLDDIGKLDRYEPEDWNEFFKTHPDQWTAKTPQDLLKQQAFCKKFQEFGIDTALTVQWPDPSSLEKGGVESLLALGKQLPKGMQRALTKQLSAIEEAEKEADAMALREQQEAEQKAAAEAEEARLKEEAAALPAFPKDQNEIDALGKAEVEDLLALQGKVEMPKDLVQALQARLETLSE